MSKVNLIFYNFDNNVPLIAELVRFYQGREEFEVEVINSAAEVNQFLMTSEQGILFFQVKTKKDLQDGVAVLKTNKKGIKKGLIKPACISTITNRKVETLLAKYGCQDILDPQTKAKTLTFKLDFWSKPIKKLLQKMQKEEQLLMQKADAKNAENNNANEKQDFEMTKSLELQSDFWLVKAKADYKRILKRYLIRLLGPSPHIGTWIELDPQPGDKQPTWKWVLKDPDNEDYVVDDGAWFFYGAKPEFDWKIKRWSFASDAPHLYFYARSGEVFSKFKFQEGVVRIAENSEFANLREEMILETCDSKFNFEGEGIQDEDSKNLEGDGDGADNIDGTLSGDADNEASAGTLSGKGSAADRFGDDPVSGKGGAVDELGNPIEGKGSAADRYGDDPLSGKGGAVDELGNPIEGKGSAADRYGDDPLSGKAATDALGNPIEGKGSAADRYGDDPLSGKGSAADSYGDDPLSGKAATDALGNPIDGKGSAADRYGDDPLSGKSSATDSYGDDPLSGKAATDALGNPIEGKGSAADRYGDDPLSGKAATDAMGNPIDGKGSPADRYGDDPLGGKGSAADHYGDDPLGGKGSAADHYGDDPLSGKAATDALGNPIDGKGAPADRYGDNPLGGKGSAADHYGDDPLSGKAATDAMGNPVDGKGSPADRYGDNPLGGKGSRADHYGDRPLEGRLDQQPKPGQLDPKAVKLDPASLKQAIDKAGDQLDPALKEKLENAQSLDDLIPNADKLSADELKAALDELGLPDGLLDELDLAKPLAELNEQKLALEQLDASLADLIKNAQSLDDLIPNLDELSAAELEEAKKKLGIDDDILDKLNLGQPILKHMKKKQALEKLTPAVQALAKEATSLNDLIPDADKLSPAELAEAKKRLGIDDDILDALDLGNPILNPRRMTMADAKDVVIDNALRDEKKKEDSDDLDDYFNEKKRERERLQELAEKNGSEDYLAKERERKRALAEKAEAEGQEIGDYYNEKKRRAEEVRKREEELEKEYASREASKKDSLNQHSVDHGDRTIDGKPTAAQKEQELFDALGGGLTDGATSDFSGQMIGSAREEEVNLESGDLQVVISQKLGANNEVNMICEFEDFYSEELVVKVPKGSFAFGVDTEVGATVTLTYNGQKIEVKSKGKVVEVEALNESKETLIIELFEIDAKKYETFITLYEDRQQSIMDFMKLAKGY